MPLARFDPLRTQEEVRRRRKSDPEDHPFGELQGTALAVADGYVGKYHDLLKHEMLPSYLAADPDGDVVVAYGAAGYKGRGSAVSWWRTHPGAEPTAHRVRERLCAAGAHAATYHAAADTLWVARSAPG